MNQGLPLVLLIVDDEPEACWTLEQVLRRHGFSTERALSAASALEVLANFPIAVVLLDAKLPDMDGLALAKKIRTLQPRLPILLVSGYFYQDDEAIREARSAGFVQEFIAKPFLHSEIIGAVTKVLLLQESWNQ